MEKVSANDVATIEFFDWIDNNCSQREKELIFLAHRYSNAYLSKRKIEVNQSISNHDADMLVKVERLIEQYGCPDLGCRQSKTKYDLMFDVVKGNEKC